MLGATSTRFDLLAGVRVQGALGLNGNIGMRSCALDSGAQLSLLGETSVENTVLVSGESDARVSLAGALRVGAQASLSFRGGAELVSGRFWQLEQALGGG